MQLTYSALILQLYARVAACEISINMYRDVEQCFPAGIDLACERRRKVGHKEGHDLQSQ